MDVQLTGTRTVKITNNVSHTGLVTHEGGQVDGLGLVILGERLNATTVGSATLAIKLNRKIFRLGLVTEISLEDRGQEMLHTEEGNLNVRKG